MGSVTEITDADFDALVVKSDKPVVVDYWAEWCGPCKQIAPVLEELAAEHGSKVDFVKINADTNPVSPANSFVRGLPTIQVWHNGEIVKSFTGAKPKSAFLKAIEDYL